LREHESTEACHTAQSMRKVVCIFTLGTETGANVGADAAMGVGELVEFATANVGSDVTGLTVGWEVAGLTVG
jgi:hypothetical protein